MDPNDFVSGLPNWINASLSSKGDRLILRGNNGWAGQPVINRIRIRLKGPVSKVSIDRAMAASWSIKGADHIEFGPQAGAITKRVNSVIDFKGDGSHSFSFANTTKEHGPFNHMQRFRVHNFGPKDVIELRNIGRTFRLDDLQSVAAGLYGLPGVPPTSLVVTLPAERRRKAA